MTDLTLRGRLDSLLAHPTETEWLEFKHNKASRIIRETIEVGLVKPHDPPTAAANTQNTCPSGPDSYVPLMCESKDEG